MSGRLVIEELRGGVGGREIISGVSLEVGPGEVHAVMGPNGSGKSTIANLVMGRPGYVVTGGSVRIEQNGSRAVDLLSLPTWKRAQAGLFFGLQKPLEVPGVSLFDALAESFLARGEDPSTVPDRVRDEAERIDFDARFLTRPLNVDLSGGERKRNETVQMGVLRPRYAMLDEIDSGLDVDALRAVARRVEELTHDDGLGVLCITHFSRIFNELRPDRVHVLSRGLIVDTGGPELVADLELEGYTRYEPATEDAATPPDEDPFADPLA